MQGFFELENIAERSPEQIIDILFKELKINYEYVVLKELSRKEVIKAYYHDKYIYIMPWVRPMSLSLEDLPRHLSDYPRLNLPHKIAKLDNDVKRETMLHLCKEYNLYFLVILPRAVSPDLYWLEAYAALTPEQYVLSYRKSNTYFDRMRIKKANHRDFLTIDKLRKHFTKTIKNEGKRI